MAHIQLIGLSERKSPDNKIWKLPYAFPIIIKELQKTNHTFEVLDIHLHKKTPQEVLEFLEKSEAKIYGISAWSHNYPLVKEMAQVIRRRHRDATIIVGGILTGNDDVLIKCTEVDIAVTGAEGEFILPELLDTLDDDKDSLNDIKGITFKDKKRGEVIKTNKREVMSIDKYQLQEMPAYEYFDNELTELIYNLNSRKDLPVKGFPLLTMRGCPFQCTFCGHLYGRNFLRKNWPAFFDEADFLIKRYGVEGFFSHDANMFLNKKDVDDFCNIYKERKSIFTLCMELRPDFGDYDMFKKLFAYGGRVVIFGFESGSQYMLDRMKKGYNLEKMKAVVKAAIDAGLIIHGNFIFGTPGENIRTIADTKKFMLLLEEWINEQKMKFRKQRKINTSGYGWSYIIPSPTSELYNIAIKNNFICNEEMYLMSLGDENAKLLLKGSNFKVKLAHIGGDVNMSEFTSKPALLSYVKSSVNLVKLRAYLFDKYSSSKEWRKILKCTFKIIKEYLKYIFITLCDIACR